LACGHYVGVVKVDGEYVRCQDSSEDDVTRNGGSIQAPGRIMTARDTFDANSLVRRWASKRGSAIDLQAASCDGVDRVP
jgi:hypothetical protein